MLAFLQVLLRSQVRSRGLQAGVESGLSGARGMTECSDAAKTPRNPGALLFSHLSQKVDAFASKLCTGYAHVDNVMHMLITLLITAMAIEARVGRCSNRIMHEAVSQGQNKKIYYCDNA